jgi:hypothetical protein
LSPSISKEEKKTLNQPKRPFTVHLSGLVTHVLKLQKRGPDVPRPLLGFQAAIPIKTRNPVTGPALDGFGILMRSRAPQAPNKH